MDEEVRLSRAQIRLLSETVKNGGIVREGGTRWASMWKLNLLKMIEAAPLYGFRITDLGRAALSRAKERQ
jgi:hypothetical protein